MTLLLVVIYVAFIGLGIPDSLFGSALSSIIEEFGLPLSASNLVSSLVSFCTVISSLFAARLLIPAEEILPLLREGETAESAAKKMGHHPSLVELCIRILRETGDLS